MKNIMLLTLLLTCFFSYPVHATTTTYSYDEQDRLHIINLGNGDSITYEYDQIGNILSKTVSGYIATITSSASTGGAITPSGLIYLTNSSIIFTITPSSGYVIAKVLVDGVSQGAIASYVFANITTNHTIEAFFDIDPTVCSNPPVRIVRATPVYFSSLQAAYNAAVNGETIQAQTYLLQENFVATNNIAVIIDGGYTCAFDSNPGRTTLLGSATLNSGTVTLQNFQLSY